MYKKLARELQITGSDKSSVCKRNKSDGVVRDAITDQSTQHARKFVSHAVDTRAHAHRYYRILPTCGRALNRSMNKWFNVNRGRLFHGAVLASDPEPFYASVNGL